MIKTVSILLLLHTLITAEAKMTHEETDDANDEKYQALIIGRWIEDKEQQELLSYPIYIDYFADGRSVAKLFDEETCVELMELKGYWKILDGNLYYKTDFETDWSLDRILKMTDTHHVLRSKGETLYRKKGTVCGE